jgi:hypothetical protein
MQIIFIIKIKPLINNCLIPIISLKMQMNRIKILTKA